MKTTRKENLSTSETSKKEFPQSPKKWTPQETQKPKKESLTKKVLEEAKKFFSFFGSDWTPKGYRRQTPQTDEEKEHEDFSEEDFDEQLDEDFIMDSYGEEG